MLLSGSFWSDQPCKGQCRNRRCTIAARRATRIFCRLSAISAMKFLRTLRPLKTSALSISILRANPRPPVSLSRHLRCMYTPYEIDASEGFSRGPPGGFLSAHSVGSAKETPGGPPLVEGGTALGATGNEVLVDSDVEVYAYQLETAVAALSAFRMKQQAHALTELMQHNIALLRHRTPPAGTPAAVQGATGLESWLFCSFDSEAASLQPPNPPSQRSVWGRNLDRASLEAELKAAIEGPPGSLQWLHALSHVAADEQAAQAILDIAAMDPSFPCAGVQRQILLTLCSLSVDTSRINDVLNLVFGPTDQPAATDEQRIGRIIKKTTEAGALQERKVTAAAAACVTPVAAARSAAGSRMESDVDPPQMQQQLHRQTLFAGDEAWSFLWHLVGLAYQREAASPSSSQAAFRRCSALCFLCALQLSPFSLCSFEAALPVEAAARAVAAAASAATMVGCLARPATQALAATARRSSLEEWFASLQSLLAGYRCDLVLSSPHSAAVAHHGAPPSPPPCEARPTLLCAPVRQCSAGSSLTSPE
ncbi:uncharacterized protein LOC34617556 [Cyclospora cayetanensis]|uniref:Uncharacterized protein LOC34617556 n=1 Tax=Cyclospora cayetanensis TaxID=88456 RepID=A0A6P6RX69_9EIME|nr:uncharacterized protein LOC34617556 [Cyclospora cayetanensis]